MRLSTIFACITLLLAGANPLAAQEAQVPLDERGRVQTVDVSLARQLGLWVDEYPGFQEARLFRTADSSFVLEITTSRQGQISRQRVPMTADEVATLRSDVSARIAGRAPRVGVDQKGRYLLLGQTTLAGVGFYGWGVPYALDTNDATSGGLYLVTAGASFFLPFLLTQNQPVSYGMANLSRYGITRGAAHGLLLHNLFLGDDDEEPVPVCTGGDVCYVAGPDDDDDRRRVAFALLGSVAEGVAGYAWARGEQMSAGTANTITLGGDFGLLWGLGAAYLGGTEDIGTRSTAVVALPAAALGLVAGHSLAAHRDYVWGDADVLYTAGLLGAYAGGAAVALVDDDAGRGITAAAILGSAAGLYFADQLVTETDFTVGQSTLNRLGTLAGALAGASIGVMADDEKVALAGSALGALAGFGITYATLAPQAKDQRGEAISGLRVRLTPSALLGAALPVKRGRPAPALPLLSVQYRLGAN
jgi:hypothetical protein